METLFDFINLTKAVEYLIAVVYLLLFPLYWKHLQERPGREEGGK